MAFIDIRNIGMAYKTTSSTVKAIENINLGIEEGEFVSFVGPTGCGKTTLLKIIGGILEPTAGSVTVRNEFTDEARKKRQFGVVFQDPVLLPWRTGIDNLMLVMEVAGIDRDERYKRCQDLLNLVGLQGFENSYPHELSGGMQQRVAIVRALSFNPSILLIDEPFANLDEITKQRLYTDFLAIWEKEMKTVVFVTHDIREAVLFSDRIVIFSTRPGTIKEVVPIILTRPRKVAMMETIEFIECVKKVRLVLEA